MSYHVPVMLRESVDALGILPDGVYADLTLGGGGHASAILASLGARGRLFCFDRDFEAFGNAPRDVRVVRVHSDFRFLWRWMSYYGVEGFDGVVADLGVSSRHFDSAERGFSYRFDGPLDMRMNGRGGCTAAEVVNGYSRQELADLLRFYGEVSRAWPIAGGIIAAREESPIRTTGDLRRIVEASCPGRGEGIRELPRVFQALRIEVNGELDALESMLVQLSECVRPGGRVVIISYHSLEDRMVKNFLRSGRSDGRVEKDLRGDVQSPFQVVTRRAVLPSEEEVSSNSRSRSAKLRVGERL